MKFKKMSKLLGSIRSGVEEQTRQTLEEMKQRAQELTPTDTGELISSYKTTYDSGSLSGVIKNDAPHAGFIEFGTNRAVNYHKGPPRGEGTRYRRTGEYKGLRGARMLTQTADEFRPKFKRQITSKINEKILSSS